MILEGISKKGIAFRIRPHIKADIEALPSIVSHRQIIENLLELPYPYTLEDARQWVNRNIHSSKHKANNLTLAIEVAGKLAGGIGLMEIVKGHKAVIGYWLAMEYWSQGITTQAVRLLVDHAFQEYALLRIEAGVFDGNLASRKVLERNGFQMEGILRRRLKNRFDTIHDERMYARFRDQPDPGASQ